MVRLGVYLRVSTNVQETSNQIHEMQRAFEQRGWVETFRYEDRGVSGATPASERNGLSMALQDASKGAINVLAAWSVDRLGRSMQDVVSTMLQLRSVGCGLYLHNNGFDTTTPAGRAMFGMMAVFADLERELIRDRVLAGLERAKAAGVRLGAPEMPVPKRAEIDNRLVSTNQTYQAIATALGTSLGYVAMRAKALGITRKRGRRVAGQDPNTHYGPEPQYEYYPQELLNPDK